MPHNGNKNVTETKAGIFLELYAVILHNYTLLPRFMYFHESVMIETAVLTSSSDNKW
jgi:hypothetical protein